MAQLLQNEDAMYLVGFVVFAMVFAALMNLFAHSGGRRRVKHCKRRAVATIVKESTFERHRGNVREDIKSGRWAYTFRKAEYEFEVDGQRYTGIGEVYFLNSLKRVKIWYDPQNPGHNCTAFDKNEAYGIHVLYGYAGVIGFFVLVFLILKHFA